MLFIMALKDSGGFEALLGVIGIRKTNGIQKYLGEKIHGTDGIFRPDKMGCRDEKSLIFATGTDGILRDI